MKHTFIYFIIYILFFSTAHGQNIYLKAQGIDSISSHYLTNHSYQLVFKNTKKLQQETLKIKKQLLQNGYFNSYTSPLEKINDTTFTQRIKINNQYKNIIVSYPKEITKNELLKTTSINTQVTNNTFTCPTTQLEKNLNNILKHITDSGKTFSSLQLKNIYTKNKLAFATLEIQESKTNTISHIIIKGYEKFPKKFIQHYLKIKPNQILNLSELEEKEKLLNKLPFSKNIKKPQLLFLKENTTLYFYIKKQKSNTFDGYLGFNTNNDNQKLEFNGNLNIKLINNLNKGEAFYLKYISTAQKQKRINLKIEIPYIFNSAFDITSELNIFKKDSSFTTNQQNIQLKYPLQKNIKLGTGIRFTKSTLLNESANHSEAFNKNEILINATHTIIQEHSFFKTKNYTFLELSTTKRKTQNASTPQQSIYLSSAHILNLNSKNSIYLKNETYYLITNEILENEMHFIGGIQSLRGFQENSIPTYQYSYLNTEYRMQLNNKLYFHTVLDYGINKRNYSTDKLFGFGFGFGLRSKNNLLKFVFANSKTNNEKIKLSNSKIHLSLKTSF